MNKLENLDDRELLYHFEKAVCDNNYNPSSIDYNQSGFTYDELRSEILKRMFKYKHEHDE